MQNFKNINHKKINLLLSFERPNSLNDSGVMLALFIGFFTHVIFKILSLLSIHFKQLVLVHIAKCVERFILLLLLEGHLLHLMIVHLCLLFSHQLAINDVLLLLAIVVHFK